MKYDHGPIILKVRRSLYDDETWYSEIYEDWEMAREAFAKHVVSVISSNFAGLTGVIENSGTYFRITRNGYRTDGDAIIEPLRDHQRTARQGAQRSQTWQG